MSNYNQIAHQSRSMGFGGLPGGQVDINFPSLQFGGPGNTLADDSKFLYTLSLQNTAASGTATGRLFAPDSLSTGRVVEGAFNDTSSAAGLVGAGNPRTVAFLNEFVNKNPCLINKIYVTSTSTTNFNYTWTVKRWSPFTDQLESEPLRPYAKTNEYREQATEMTIRQPIFVGNQSYIEIPVLFGTTLYLHMHFAAIQNDNLLFYRTIEQLMQQYRAQ